MTTALALAYGSVALAGACWGVAVALLPSEQRWKRAVGVGIGALFVGAMTWLLVFSAGAAFTIARGAGYLPMGEIATTAGGVTAAAVGIGVAVALRKRARA